MLPITILAVVLMSRLEVEIRAGLKLWASVPRWLEMSPRSSKSAQPNRPTYSSRERRTPRRAKK